MRETRPDPECLSNEYTVSDFMAWLGILLAAFLTTAIEGMTGEGIGPLLVFPVASIFGFIPLFIYGAWLGAQLQA